MQVQSVDNTRFKSRNSIEKASAFVNMNDSQLRDLAYVMSYDKDNQKKKNKSILSTFYTIPIVDTIASGVLVAKTSHITKEVAAELRTAPLSARAFATANTAANWGFIMLAVGLFNVIKKAINNNSPGLKKFEKENPVQSFVLDTIAIIGGLTAAGVGLWKLNNKIINKHPEAVVKAEIDRNRIIEKLDNTKFNKEILPKLVHGVDKLAEKAPRLMKASRYALANSVWILLGAGILKTMHNSKREHENVERNYEKLKEAQLQTAKHLNKVLRVESAVLAQNQALLATELRNQMSKTKAQKIEEPKEEAPEV